VLIIIISESSSHRFDQISVSSPYTGQLTYTQHFGNEAEHLGRNCNGCVLRIQDSRIQYTHWTRICINQQNIGRSKRQTTEVFFEDGTSLKV